MSHLMNTSNAGRIGLLLAISFLIVFFLPLAAEAKPTLTLSGDITGGALEVGGHLDAAFSGVTPFDFYTIQLLDESEQVIAELANQQAGIGGSITARRLWTRTGVVGCDVGAVHDPSNYQYISFNEADSILDGRTFEVRLVEAADPTRLLSRKEVELRAVVEFVEGYPSDGAGCLRTEMHVSEPLHLSIAHQGAGLLPLQIHLVDATNSPGPGDTIIDVRGIVQVIGVPAGADPWVELLWLVPVAGEYEVIVRPNGSTGPFDPAVDLKIETGVQLVGATANQCPGICPP